MSCFVVCACPSYFESSASLYSPYKEMAFDWKLQRIGQAIVVRSDEVLIANR
jgi:hypothetical protein